MRKTTLLYVALLLVTIHTHAQEKSRYMGGEVELVTALNGAIVNAEVLKNSPQITYLEPTIDKVAEGVWCIGGYSLANCTVIETEDGLIIKISSKPEEGNWLYTPGGGMVRAYQSDPKKISAYVPPKFIKNKN